MKRGKTYSVKYRDASGKQCWERLGTEAEGWTDRKAERELGVRLSAVEKDRYRRPDKITFGVFAERFTVEYLPGRKLKATTERGYKDDIRLHLEPEFGALELAELASRPELIDRYVTKKIKTLSPKTVRNHVTLLGLMFKVARRWKLVTENPVDVVDKPRGGGREMEILTGQQIGKLLAAYDDKIAWEVPDEARWWKLARCLHVVALGTGFRRGELLALRWDDVRFADGLITVDEAYVAGEFTTPKSRTSHRTIEMGPVVMAALKARLEETAYGDPEDLVFGHPDLGTPLDPSKLARERMRKMMDAAGIPKSFRVFHDLRHTSLTHDAAVNVHAHVKHKAGHSSSQITDRYIHAASSMFPGAAARGEGRMFGTVEP